MAKELEITSIICFLLALIPACSRRLVIKTKRDSKRRDSSKGVKKREKFGSSRVMFFTRADSTQPSSLFHFSAAFSPSTISFRFTNWTPATGYPLWFFFSFSTEGYFHIEYFVVIHDLYFQALLCWTYAYIGIPLSVRVLRIRDWWTCTQSSHHPRFWPHILPSLSTQSISLLRNSPVWNLLLVYFFLIK